MKNLKTLLVFGLLLGAVPTVLGQQVWPHWEAHTTSDNVISDYKMVIDGSDYSYVTGFFEGSADFDPGVGTHILTAQARDIFIQKLDPFGNLVWAHRIGSGGNDYGNSIAVDNAGNIVIVGSFQQTVDFDPGVGVVSSAASLASDDIYILKLDTDGNYIWHSKIGSVANDKAWDVGTDAADNVFVTGTFDATVDFDPGAGIVNLLTNGGDDVFMLKLTSAGNFDWAKNIGSTTFDSGRGLEVDASGNVIFTGFYNGPCNLDPNGGVSTSPVGMRDAYVVKLDNSGNTIFAVSVGGGDIDEGMDLATDPSGNIMLAGFFASTADFNPGAANTMTASNGGLDGFLLKLDALGNYMWVRTFGGTSSDWLYSVSHDPIEDRLYIAGTFTGTADLDPGPANTATNTYGSGDWFFEKLDYNGNMKWLALFGGVGWDDAGNIYRDSQGMVKLSGSFDGLIDLDVSNGINFVTPGGTGDDFAVLTIEQCADKDTTLQVTECTSYTLPSGNSTINATGTYYDTIPTVLGCDSLLTIEVVITGPPAVDAGQNQTVCDGDFVTLNGAGADTYTWPAGITDGVSFTPPVGTNYYVVQGADTNGCIGFDTVQVDVLAGPTLTVSPNQAFCQGDSVHLNASGASAYDWESGASSNSEYSLLPTVSDTIEVVGYDSFGCSTTNAIYLTYDDPANVDAGIDYFGCGGDQVTLSGVGGGDYFWDGPNVDIDMVQTITFNLDTGAYYFLTVQTVNGCEYTDSVFVGIDPNADCGVIVFNAFSPNGDGVNDFLGITGIEDYPDNQLAIFNRWGDAVFIGDNYNNVDDPWPGTNYNGKPLPTGTYYYVLTINENGEERSVKGWVQLVR